MDPAQDTPGVPAAPTRVLIVDDDESSRELLSAILRSRGYEVRLAENGVAALAIADEQTPDIVVSDILMPEMDGFQLCMRWRATQTLCSTPFVFCSADYVEPEDRAFALSLGAVDFLLKPLDPDSVALAIEGALQFAAHQAEEPATGPAASVSLETMRRYSERLFNKLQQKVLALEDTERRLRRSMNGCLTVVSAAMESRDPYTHGHETRVALLAVAIAQRLVMDVEEIDGIRIAGRLHDIGKIAVPTEILSKPGRLSVPEFEIVKTHAAAGAAILKDSEFDHPIDRIVLQHHERMDGSGYPQGLDGNDILFAARIIAVADVVEAMSSHRPYRPALPIETALDEIRTKAGVLYDPSVVDACLWLFESGAFDILGPVAGRVAT